jgi:hypothetical protein
VRWLFAVIAAALLGTGAGACGNIVKATDSTVGAAPHTAENADGPALGPSSTRPVQLKRDSDGDTDNPGSSYYDKDDAEILAYGKAANTKDRLQITALVKRYYAVAAAGDGAAGCSLTYSLIDESTVENYAQNHPTLRGKTCAEVMSNQFEQDRAQLAAGSARLHVISVRVGENRGYALLGAGKRPERSLLVHRESGAWKTEALVDSALP